MKIYQANRHIAHTTNKRIHILDEYIQSRKVMSKDIKRSSKHINYHVRVFFGIARGVERFEWMVASNMWMRSFVWQSHRSWPLGPNLVCYLGQCTIKTSTQPDGFPRQCDLGPLAPKAYKTEPRSDPSSRVTDGAANSSYRLLANTQHK